MENAPETVSGSSRVELECTCKKRKGETLVDSLFMTEIKNRIIAEMQRSSSLSDDQSSLSDDEEENERKCIIATENPGFSGATGTQARDSFSTTSATLPPTTFENSSFISAFNKSFFWSPNPPLSRPSIPFTGRSGLLQTPNGNEPQDFFNLLFTDEFFQLLARETNTFAGELLLRQGVTSRSRIREWKNTSVSEMKIFLGLLFHMGMTKVSRLVNYWNTNEKFNLTYFPSRMSRDRWLLLQRAFHLAPNPLLGQPIPEDPLYKIRPLLEFFHNTMKKIQDPGQIVCIDESMLPWRGQVSFRQYIPNAKRKYGIKFYVLAEPDGLIHRFLIYADSADKEIKNPEHATNVVFKLMSGLLREGRSIYMGDYYTSVDLAFDLLSHQTFITGTLSASQKNNPSDVTATKLRQGELIQRWSQEGINVTKWKDEGEVLTISTEFSGDLVESSGRRVNDRMPEVVVKYNNSMRGMGRLDQFLSYYISPRRTLQWYKKISFYILEIMLINCYILYHRYSEAPSRLDLHEFRLAIIEYLCGPNPAPSPPVNASASPKIINRTHFPRVFQLEEGKVRKKQIRCRQCYKLKKTKYVSTYCSGCPEKPGLCINDCFLNYHENRGFNFI